ncbi:hypothetical protein FI667_g12441, partial [Globisporangium splendens]
MPDSRHQSGSTGGGAMPAAPSTTSSGSANAASAAAVVGGAECWDSISYLESAFHHGFMRSRQKTSSFVYHENTRLTRELDEFCDVDAMHRPKGPIIFLGESGVGKSTFFANWLVRRKKMFQNWQTSYPEFIFYHVVGCSRQSCYVSNLLERILREIKEYFELNKEIPDVEERLSWQFPRFLEAASKKSCVILVIDGLQRLRTNDGESILKWVPLAFPPNVRIIFSGTINYPTTTFLTPRGGGGNHSIDVVSSEHLEKANLNAQMIERIKLEANRRNWISVHVPPLAEDDRRRVVKKFVQQYHPTHSASERSGLLDAANGTTHPTPHSEVLGLQLFEIQQKALASVPMSANPHFLKLSLASMAWAVDEGFNIHVVFEHWFSAESNGQLMEAILRSMETGFAPDPQGTADANQFLVKNNFNTAAYEAQHIVPLCRKTSDTMVEKTSWSTDVKSGSGDASNRLATTPGRAASNQRLQEFDYHDSRIPSITPAFSSENKTVTTSSVIELRYDGMQYRRSSSPLTTMSTSDDGVSPEPSTRTESVHEMKEVFVPTLRHDNSGGSTHHHTSLDDRLAFGHGQPNTSTLPARLNVPATPAAQAGSAVMRLNCMHPGKSGAVPIYHSQTMRVPQSTANTASGGGKCSGLPAYLTGGRVVAPLEPLLRRALCLLYVCRHGLLTNELRFVLNAIVTEERNAAKETNQLHLKAPFGSVENVDHESLTGFSEDQWKMLLRAMKPLGILFLQDVIVLPICKEILREVVWWRYIGSKRIEQKYHQWMIRFFRIHPTTFRRVEELPWHLKRCCQWDALRNVLVNLPMFQLLYTANYKNELFGYWKTLTDGPLLIYNNPSDKPATSSTDPRVYAVPFDIVKEYGKSVEEWYKNARPPTKVFTPIVQLLTKFMYEFSLFYQGYLPSFNYAPFDLKKLFHDGFTFIEDLPHVKHSSNSSAKTAATSTATSSGLSLAAPAATEASALLTALESFSTLGQGLTNSSTSTGSTLLAASSSQGSTSSSSLSLKEKEGADNWFFFYQRWIWIQFPWLALGKEIVIREPFVRGNNVINGSSGSSSGNNQQTLSSLGVTTFNAGGSGGPVHESSSHSSSSDAVTEAADEEQRREGGDPRHSVNGTASSLAPLHSSATRLAIHFDARFWDVKKSMFDADTSSGAPMAQKRKGALSPSKICAMQNSSVLSPSPTTKTQDIISPENLFRKKTTYAAVKNVLSSSIRKLPSAIANASLPLASVPEQIQAGDGGGAPTFLTTVSSGSGTVAGGDPSGTNEPQLELSSVPGTMSKPSLATKDLVLEHLNVSDTSSSLSTAFGLPAHFQDYPQSEWDLKKSYNYQVVLKLQTLYDSMKLEAHKKQSHLQMIKAKIKETKKRYELSIRECDMAKHAADEMSSRMEKIEQMMVNIDKQEKNHRKLIRGCEVFPACDPSHFETMKKELKLLQMKLKDLTEEKKVLDLKKTHLQTVELPVLRKVIDKNKKLLSAVVEKLEHAREKLVHDQASTDKLYQRRLEMIDGARNASFKGTGESLEQHDASSSELVTSVTTRSLVAKVALQQCESMCENIQKATGFSKLELILQKFVSRDELNQSFEDQPKIYEARLKQIKLHQAELEQQLHSLEVSNAVAASDDPRVLEEKLHIAEVELARVERTQNSLLTTSKEVVAGALRIVKLIGTTSCRNPSENAIPATRLWPPPLGFDGESSLSSEFESLEPNDIAALLQICQDRAGLMIDAAGEAIQMPIILRRGYTSRGDDKLLTKNGKQSKKQPHNSNSTVDTDKRDRGGFGRGSVPAISFPIPSLSSSLAAGNTTNRSELPDHITHDAIKASSRSRVLHKKAHSSGHGAHGNNHLAASASSASNSTANN